jgi:TrmH family RNA methyltransferase
MAAMKITSRANPEIKRIKKLEMRKYREEEGLFIAEGLRHALEAAEAGWDFHALVLEDGLARSGPLDRLLNLVEGRGCRILEVPRDILESLSRRDNAQKVLAVLHQRFADFDTVRPTPGSLFLALEEVRDPGNLGTILRTADAVGASGIILVGACCDPFSLEAVRASMGSFPVVPIARCGREEIIARLTEGGFNSLGTHLATDTDYRRADYARPLMLVMGNEQAGLSDALTAACSGLVKIPMRGRADSLNLSVATGVMLYEAVRGA